MRRLEVLKVAVHCPHFARTVTATKNTAIDRLVDCAEKDACRDPNPESDGREAARPYPHGCPVFPSLAK
jgi:hypothetical protein